MRSFYYIKVTNQNESYYVSNKGKLIGNTDVGNSLRHLFTTDKMRVAKKKIKQLAVKEMAKAIRCRNQGADYYQEIIDRADRIANATIEEIQIK